MDFIQLIQNPIRSELSDFIELFDSSLQHADGLLASALGHIRERGGKRMRPMLMLLLAKNFGSVNQATQHAAVGLELLHTASLIHDDVVDESSERRGQASVNASYDNKVAVLVGDYVLSTALQQVAQTGMNSVVNLVACLGKTLADGEIMQLTNIRSEGFSEQVYYDIISRKTAALFETCASVGAETGGAEADEIAAAARFGHSIGVIFQIRDDIFDYFDSKSIGKPTGNDMLEGKLTLPAIYALRQNPDPKMIALAQKVKDGTVGKDEIAELIEFTKQGGGIEYAEKSMLNYHADACSFIDDYVTDDSLKQSLRAYLDFMIERDY